MPSWNQTVPKGGLSRCSAIFLIGSIILAVFAGIGPLEAEGAGVSFGGGNDVGASTDWVTSVATADFDNDGDMDIVSGSRGGEDYEIIIWQNDGTPFSGLWTQNDVGATASFVCFVAVADLDNDGYMDILTGCYDIGEDYSLIAWQNDGTPFDGLWTQHDIGVSGDEVSGVAAADFDNDGRMDIVSANHYGSPSVSVWQNDGTPWDGLWTMSEVGSVSDCAQMVATGDLDDDGLTDVVVGTYSGTVVIFENDGTPWDGAWSSYTIGGISGTNPDVLSVDVGDVDNDGDLDIVNGYGENSPGIPKVYLWENDGTPWGSWSQFEVADGGSSVDPSNSVRFMDANNDGWLDIVAGWGSGHITLMENDGTPFTGGLWTAHNVSTSTVQVFSVAPADLDDDTDMDIVSGSISDEDYEVIAWKNTLDPAPVNGSDRDDDGVIDSNDAFPDNPYEYVDTDGDGMGDNLDPDADGDGVPDERDVFPLDKKEWQDTDGDGTGDKADIDDDNDGVPDTKDAFPKNPNEFMDSDGDGIGDNLDPDADGDRYLDERDAFPLNAEEWNDTDRDGMGDNADPDDDNDGVNDTLDAFPRNPTEFSDSDRDGIGDYLDPDDDNDTVPDLLDAFPFNATEWYDTDHDGTGDNADLDDDGDGVNDVDDAFPTNPREYLDADGDGIGDNLDPDDDNDGIADDVEARDALNERLDDILSAVVLIGDQLERDMMDVNGSLHGSLSSLRSDFLLELEGVNSSLALDIQDMLDRITSDTAGLNVSMQARLTSMLGTIRSDTDSLGEWLDLVIGQLRTNLTEVQGNISTFEGSTEENLTGISSTLEDLQKLETILKDIDALDRALDQAKGEISKEGADNHTELLGRSNVDLALIVVVLVLALIILVLLLRIRKST